MYIQLFAYKCLLDKSMCRVSMHNALILLRSTPVRQTAHLIHNMQAAVTSCERLHFMNYARHFMKQYSTVQAFNDDIAPTAFYKDLIHQGLVIIHHDPYQYNVCVCVGGGGGASNLVPVS